MSWVICDRRIAAGVKGKVFKMLVRPTVMYGFEMVALTKKYIGDWR